MDIVICDHLLELNRKSEIKVYKYLELHPELELVGLGHLSPKFHDSCVEIRECVERKFNTIQASPTALYCYNEDALYLGGYKFNRDIGAYDSVSPEAYFEMIILSSNQLSLRAQDDFEALCEIFLLLVNIFNDADFNGQEICFD